MTTRETGTAAKERLLQAQYGWIDKPRFLFPLHFFICLFISLLPIQPRCAGDIICSQGLLKLWPSYYGPVIRNFGRILQPTTKGRC